MCARGASKTSHERPIFNRGRDQVPKNFILCAATAAFIITVDQVTKACVSLAMSLHESIVVIGGVFNITYVRNPGAAFGFLATAGPAFRTVFFVAITVAAIVLILYYLYKTTQDEPLLVFSLSLILAGAVGNLIDRVRFGEVIDFLDVYIGVHHWPAFNVADTAISLGAILLIIHMVRDRQAERRTG